MTKHTPLTYLLMFLIFINQAFANTYETKIDIDFQAYKDKSYDKGVFQQWKPDLYIKVLLGDQLLFKSDVAVDQLSFQYSMIASIQDYMTIHIEVYDEDLKSDDLLMRTSVIFLPNQKYTHQTTDPQVEDSVGGHLSISVNHTSSEKVDADLTEQVQSTINALSETIFTANNNDYEIDNEMTVEFCQSRQCANQLAPIYQALYRRRASKLLEHFSDLLTFHIYDESRDDGFINWINGWGSGYKQAGVKALDGMSWLLGEKSKYLSMSEKTNRLEELIQREYLNRAFTPTMSIFEKGLEAISVELLNDFAARCGSLIVSEQVRLAEIYELGDYRVSIKNNGLVENIIRMIEKREYQKSKIKEIDNVPKYVSRVKNIKTSVKYASKLLGKKGVNPKVLKDIVSKTMSKTETQGGTKALGTALGTQVGLMVQSKALATLASKGLMGKASVLFFKASSSTLVSKLGLSAVVKGVASKAATAAGGKVLLLVAERAMGAAVSAASFGIGIAVDYLVSKGIATVSLEGMRKDFNRDNDKIKEKILNKIALKFDKQVNGVAQMIRDETRSKLLHNL